MSGYRANLPDLVVRDNANTATSNVIAGFEDAKAITIFAPGTLTHTHHVQIHASAAAATTSSGWATHTSGGSRITIAQGTAVTITDVEWGALRLSSLGVEATARTFTVTKKCET